MIQRMRTYYKTMIFPMNPAVHVAGEIYPALFFISGAKKI